MSEISASFVVEATFLLPGLGVLVLPAPPEPDWLATYALHTALAVTLPSGIQSAQPITGTVEEISQDGQEQRRALLLDLGAATLLPTGTYLQANEIYSDLL
jgi:hypothetical protein